VPERIRRAEDHWKAHGLGIWSVRDRHGGELLGHSGLLLNEPPEVELIYAFARSGWGRGFATEAASCLIDYAFTHRRLDHLNALVFPENIASRRVLEKLGFVRAGETKRFDVQLHRFTLRK
jgi:ribosomal-protein-alanine N-acetyltransferase